MNKQIRYRIDLSECVLGTSWIGSIEVTGHKFYFLFVTCEGVLNEITFYSRINTTPKGFYIQTSSTFAEYIFDRLEPAYTNEKPSLNFETLLHPLRGKTKIFQRLIEIIYGLIMDIVLYPPNHQIRRNSTLFHGLTRITST